MTETPREAARRLSRRWIEQGYRPTAVYDYNDANGAPLYHRLRLDHPDGDAAPEGSKVIRPYKRNGVGYVIGEPDFPNGKPLYNLDAIAARPGETVWVVEGEKVADALKKLGILATTSGSATSAPAADWMPLTGRACVVWRDYDDAGQAYCDAVVASLSALGCKVSIIDVDRLGLPEKGDAVDWLYGHQGATGADVSALPFMQATINGKAPTDLNDLCQIRGAEAVERALANARAPEVSEDQPRASNAPRADPALDTLAASGHDSAWKLPPPIDADEWSAARVAPDCIVENYLYADVAALIAPGATGKTTIQLYENVHLALGRRLYGLEVRKPGPSLLVSAEDPREILVARLREICEALELDAHAIAIVRRDVRISDVSGSDFRLTINAGDLIVAAPEVDDLIREARALAPVLVSFDPAISFGVGEARVNDAEQGLIQVGRRVRREVGCCARFTHHSGKQNARDKTLDQYTARGGSALPDGSRMVAVMQPLTADEWGKATGSSLLDGETGMVLARPKLSYCPPQPDLLICRRGYNFTATTRLAVTKGEALTANCAQVHQFLIAQLAAGHRHSQNSLIAADLGLSQREVRDAVATLLADRRVVNAPLPDPPSHGPRTCLQPFGVSP